MSFSLKKAIGGAIVPSSIGLGAVFRALGPKNVNAPQLPGAPQLTPYDAYPDFSPQELAYLQQQQQLLQQYQAALGTQPSAYQQTSDQIGQAEAKNYLEALNQAAGSLTEGQKQQQKVDFQKLVAAAGARGIRILGDDPMSATSDSTAGNQILSDFNQRYQTLADQNRQAQLQMGYNQNIGRLGFAQQSQQANLANILNGQTAYGNLMQPYQQQRLGAYGVRQANVDLANQSLMNNYQSQLQQQMLNYQANAQNQANRMGFINSLVGLGGTIGGAMIAGPAGAAAGGGVARAATGGGQQLPYQPTNFGGGFGYGSYGYSPYPSYNRLGLNYAGA